MIIDINYTDITFSLIGMPTIVYSVLINKHLCTECR